MRYLVSGRYAQEFVPLVPRLILEIMDAETYAEDFKKIILAVEEKIFLA